MGSYILAIDPGNRQSAYCLLGPDLRPIQFSKLDNELMYAEVCDVLRELHSLLCIGTDQEVTDLVDIVVEWVQSYGKPVGQDVFRTIEWIGMLKDRFHKAGFEVNEVVRSEERSAICHSGKANDAMVRAALIERFAPEVPNKGKGSKKDPGWFYGFRADVWQAYAVGVTYHDLNLDGR